jgi:3-phenylpropionate/trans-cinnamate dioxygenase ferredoxin subunit
MSNHGGEAWDARNPFRWPDVPETESQMTETWIDAGPADGILREDVGRFEHEGKLYALYRTEDDRYFATDGLCTHEQVDLSDGFVSGTVIECPMHNGRFDFTTGEAKGAPVCVNLATYPVRIENGRILFGIRG